MNNKNISFFGLGKLGMDCAEVFAEQYNVSGYDIYPVTSDTVNVCTIEETINKSEWIFIAVPTPHEKEYDGSIPSMHLPVKDFSYDDVKMVLHWINKNAHGPKKIVLISTILPGTARKQLYPMLNKMHTLIYNPYLIAMGTVKWDFVNPEMVIIGAEDGSSEDINKLIDIYEPLMQNKPRYEVGTWEEAEAMKIFYNTYISAKIGIVNMIQDFAMKIGNINVDVVTDALAHSDIRLQSPKYMTAGMGDAGACVLPNFTVTVNDEVITIKDLYESFDESKTNLIESANWSCTAKDQKKIDTVTCRDYSGTIIKLTDGDIIIEATPEHLIPVIRNNKRVIVRADEINESDKLIRL